MPAASDPGMRDLIGGTSRAIALTEAEQLNSLPGLPGVPAAPEGGEAGSSGSIYRLIGRVFVENKLAVVGLVIIVVMFLFSYVGPWIYHTDQVFVNISTLNGAPSGSHLLGTDSNGYDIIGRLMLAGRSSLEVGLAAAGVATGIGVIWGAVAGFFGGILDAVMMRIVDVVLSIPGLLLLIALAVILGPTKTVMILIIGGLAWLYPARLVRGETLTLRTREYVQAVRVMGGTGRRIVTRHIVPNAVGTIVVNATFQIADAILTLAALSFLGLGIQPPDTDWGQMLSNGATYIDQGYWWQIVPAGMAIVLIVVAFNFVGDALRDSLEVRLQRR
jgi:peptide/nickel transport system permease protein